MSRTTAVGGAPFSRICSFASDAEAYPCLPGAEDTTEPDHAALRVLLLHCLRVAGTPALGLVVLLRVQAAVVEPLEHDPLAAVRRERVRGAACVDRGERGSRRADLRRRTQFGGVSPADWESRIALPTIPAATRATAVVPMKIFFLRDMVRNLEGWVCGVGSARRQPSKARKRGGAQADAAGGARRPLRPQRRNGALAPSQGPAFNPLQHNHFWVLRKQMVRLWNGVGNYYEDRDTANSWR